MWLLVASSEFRRPRPHSIIAKTSSHPEVVLSITRLRSLPTVAHQISLDSSCASAIIIMPSPRANGNTNDVFLSFRGEDTRDNFTDHLYEALGRAGLRTFRDNDDIDRGRELKPEIEKAIKESRASIVVLSEKYATSTWCLEELWLVLKQRRECRHFVLPVFYHVDPSHVRKQDKTFKVEVEISSRWTEDDVNRWRGALTEVADLTGLIASGLETKFLKEIVDTIYKELDRKEVHLPSNLIGMTARCEEINSWLRQDNLEFLAIYGMGGSGKSTLAKYIYDSNLKKFENTSFLENIGSRCEQTNGLLKLQKQLLQDLLGGKKRKRSGVSQGTCKIEEALQTKRVLIVLDDIVDHNQIFDLLGRGKINAQSKVIITTNEKKHNWFKNTRWKCEYYKLRLLNDDESLELLSRHAFGSERPMEGVKELAMQAVQYCGGNPLALEVLASSLSNSNSILHWQSQLNLLEKDISSGIEAVLKRSYKSLPSKFVKELFLHIACFFIGKDMDYVAKILEQDYCATCGILTLINRCLLSVSPNKKLMMHRLIQEMGKDLVRKESTSPAKRSRIWQNIDSHKILSKRKGSERIKGLALDGQMLRKEKYAFKPSELTTDSFKKMDNLKLLQLNFVKLVGSYENFSEDLRWICWHGFHSPTIPSDLFMGNLVALDMSFSSLEVFDVPGDLQFLQILNLKGSEYLFEIRNISRLPELETLILSDCRSLVHVCETIRGLASLALLNMTGCKSLCKREQNKLLEASTSSGGVTEQPILSLPHSLQRLFLNDCNLEHTESFPLSFRHKLQYLNLSSGLFESLPSYGHLQTLQVLDFTYCSRLKRLQDLPSTLVELYVYYCESLEKITFQSHRFTLQEFGYGGCINLSDIEGFFKLAPIAQLDESDLHHLKWLKEYQSHQVILVGDDDLTGGRSRDVQMLYEFDIMSTSLPEIKDPNMTPEYISEPPSSSSLSFYVPPKNRRLKGLNITFKYTVSGDDWIWFAKIRTTNGVDLIYNPKAFGKPENGEVGIWLSYWPIGNKLHIGDQVNVSIVVMSGLKVHECGASLVYMDDDESPEKNVQWIESIGGDLSRFQLSTRTYYLCRRDFFELMVVGTLNAGWLRRLVGNPIDDTEVQGWRKTGRPTQSIPSSTELRTVRCIIHGPESDEIYKIAEMSKSSLAYKNVEFTSSILEETMKSGTTGDAATKDKSEGYNIETMDVSEALIPDYFSFFPLLTDETMESASIRHTLEETMKSGITSEISDEPTKVFPWTEEEHRMFLLGLQKLGKGNWRGIAKNYVISRTPTQVASHAQKYFIRQSNMSRRERRSSLFDMTADDVSLSLSLGKVHRASPDYILANYRLSETKPGHKGAGRESNPGPLGEYPPESQSSNHSTTSLSLSI